MAIFKKCTTCLFHINKLCAINIHFDLAEVCPCSDCIMVVKCGLKGTRNKTYCVERKKLNDDWYYMKCGDVSELY